MRKQLLAAVVFGAALIAGAAYADTIENSYGNTIIVTSANGVGTYHFDADHKYTLTAGERTIHGAWAVNNGQICLTPDGGQPACTPYVGDKKVGDHWTQTGADGSQITVEMRAGR